MSNQLESLRQLTTVVADTGDIQDQPRDYANGATGLLKDEPEKVEEPKAS